MCGARKAAADRLIVAAAAGFLSLYAASAAAQQPCCAGSGCCGLFQPSPAPACLLTYGASGTVTDSVTGLPIGGATVRVLDLPPATTASDGTFAVSGSRSETCNIDYYFSISIAAPGYESFGEALYTSAVLGHYDVALEPLASPTPTSAPPPRCVGDCDADGRVAVHELVAAVTVLLGRASLATCAAADGNRDGAIDINELVAAVANGLAGCP